MWIEHLLICLFQSRISAPKAQQTWVGILDGETGSESHVKQKHQETC